MVFMRLSAEFHSRNPRIQFRFTRISPGNVSTCRTLPLGFSAFSALDRYGNSGPFGSRTSESGKRTRSLVPENSSPLNEEKNPSEIFYLISCFFPLTQNKFSFTFMNLAFHIAAIAADGDTRGGAAQSKIPGRFTPRGLFISEGTIGFRDLIEGTWA